MHMKHTLELRPGFEPAETALKEMATMPSTEVHMFSLVLIGLLVSTSSQKCVCKRGRISSFLVV